METYNAALLITPYREKGVDHRVSIRIRTDLPGRSGIRLFSINSQVTNKVFTALENEITVTDDNGLVPCTVVGESSLHTKQDFYLPERDTVGMITIAYTVCPDPVKANPCFDLGYEDGGINGSGMTFLPLLACYECSLSVEWDLSAAPPGWRGIWSFGEGVTIIKGHPSLLQETFYYAGNIQSRTEGNFGFYWLDYHEAYMERSAGSAREMFIRLAGFFGDNGKPYRIFARKGPCDKLGGTALRRSYQFIYSDEFAAEPEHIKFLFAHEMIHNWVKMADEPFGISTWFVEGMAEYYSAVLLWNHGIVSREELLDELNRRSRRYYENPFINTGNRDAGKQLFSNRDITRVPYGRGFFYLLNIDAQLREASAGMTTLDDITLSLLRDFPDTAIPGNSDWLERIRPLLGKRVDQDFRDMESGGAIEPDAACFGGAVSLRKTTGTVRGTGDSCDLWVFE